MSLLHGVLQKLIDWGFCDKRLRKEGGPGFGEGIS